MWKIFKMVIIILAAGAIAFAIIAPSLATTGKLVGNKFALAFCKTQIWIGKNAETNSPNFDFSKLSHEDKRRTLLLGYTFAAWIRTNFVWQNSNANRQIIIVCGKEFDNVPMLFWTFYTKTPAHAVGYSDGTTGLISPAQFTNLNLNGCVSFSSLAANSEFNVFKQ
jgi:hypothetical protein